MNLTELLKKIGIAEDKTEEATKAIKEYLDGEYVPKSRFNELNAEKKKLESTVSERDKQLKALKDSEGDVEALKEQITKLQADNKAAAEKSAQELKELKMSTAVKLAIGDTAHDVDMVASLFDMDKLVMGADGKVVGVDEQLKTLKKEKAFLFKAEGDPKGQYDPAKGAGTPKVNPFAKETFNLTEQANLIEKDKATAIAMAAQAGVKLEI